MAWPWPGPALGRCTCIKHNKPAKFFGYFPDASIVRVTTSTYKRHPGEVSINDDEVILLYIEAFLISKSVSPAELALVKN